jgi:hypothetical protein
VSLTAPERESLITFSDDYDTATIHTHQRRIIIEASEQPGSEGDRGLSHDGTAGAVFELPVNLVSFRSGQRKLSPEQAKAAAADLDRTRRAA